MLGKTRLLCSIGSLPHVHLHSRHVLFRVFNEICDRFSYFLLSNGCKRKVHCWYFLGNWKRWFYFEFQFLYFEHESENYFVCDTLSAVRFVFKINQDSWQFKFECSRKAEKAGVIRKGKNAQVTEQSWRICELWVPTI